VRVALDAPSSRVLTSEVIDFGGAGDNTIVSGQAERTIRVFKVFFVASDATEITFKDGAVALTGPITLMDGGSFVLDFDGEPWFMTSVGADLVLNSSNPSQVSGRIYYTTSHL